MSLLNQISQQFCVINNSLHIEQCVALDCRRKGSSVVKQIKQLCKKTSLSVPPVGLTLETSILLGLLLKDFSNVTACTVQTLLRHIEETGIPLPTSPSSLYPLIRELHNLGLLLVIEKERNPYKNHLWKYQV